MQWSYCIFTVIGRYFLTVRSACVPQQLRDGLRATIFRKEPRDNKEEPWWKLTLLNYNLQITCSKYRIIALVFIGDSCVNFAPVFKLTREYERSCTGSPPWKVHKNIIHVTSHDALFDFLFYLEYEKIKEYYAMQCVNLVTYNLKNNVRVSLNKRDNAVRKLMRVLVFCYPLFSASCQK